MEQLTTATATQIAELANAIAYQAEAIAKGTTTASPHAAALLLTNNVATLVAWTAPRPLIDVLADDA